MARLKHLNWSGWEHLTEDHSWHNLLDPGGPIGWHGRAIVVPMDLPDSPECFVLNLTAVHLTDHQHGADVLDQPHDIHEEFNYKVGAPDLAYAQRFATTWVAATIEVFDQALESRSPLDDLHEQVNQVINEALSEV